MGRLASCLIAIVFFAGCATTSIPRHSVFLDSIRAKQVPEQKNFYIYPGFKDVAPDDLQFMEYRDYVKRLLQINGFNPATVVEDANIVIFLTYGVGEPEVHTYSYSTPVFGQTGYSSSHTLGQVFSLGNVQLFSANTTLTPKYGVVGSVTNQDSYTTYTRHIVLDAYDKEALVGNRGNRQLWRTKIISTGSSGDLRVIFPILTAAAIPVVAENTGRMIQVNLAEDDPGAQVIKDSEEISSAKEIFANLGREYHKRGMYDSALVYYKKVINTDPENALMHFRCGVAYLELRDRSSSKAWFERAIAINQGYEKLYEQTRRRSFDHNDNIGGPAYDDILSKAEQLDIKSH